MTDFVENRKTKQPNNILLQNGYIMSSLSIQYTTKKRSLNRIERARSLVDIQLFEKLYQYH